MRRSAADAAVMRDRGASRDAASSRRPPPRRRRVAAVCIVLAAALGAAPRAEQRAGPDPAAGAFRIATDDARFGPGRPTALRVVRSPGGEPVADDLRCRFVPAHADVRLGERSANGCAVVIAFEAGRTRRSRFALDPWMAVDVIVRRDGERVGFASTRLRFVD